MALKIRCPHCREVSIAPDERAGERATCSACGGAFVVPIPASESPSEATPALRCVRCRAELGPTASLCVRCFTDQRTRKRLPFAQRLARWSLPAKLLTGGAAAAVVLAAGIGGKAAWDHWSRPSTPAPVVVPTPIGPSPVDAARALLSASSPAEQTAARQALQLRAGDGVRALTAALREALGDAAAPRRANLVAAIDFLAQAKAPSDVERSAILAALGEAQKRPQLAATALRARGMLRDETAAADLARLWIDAQRHALFLMRLEQLSGDRGAGLLAAQWLAEAERAAGGLRPLTHDVETDAYERAAEAFWESWDWLGGGRGEALGLALFELAKPRRSPAGADDPERAIAEDVRTARRRLDAAAQRGSPAAAAAAALVLVQNAPQYRAARERVLTRLAGGLPDAAPADQQRVVWTLARLTGRTFENATDGIHPLDVVRADVAAVLEWARRNGVAEPGPLKTASRAYPHAPKLEYHVVPADRQLESELLGRLASWDTAGDAIERWRAAALGFTVRVEALLDPGQRAPNLPALAAAMALAAEANAANQRPQLELWSGAADQPAWVRGLARSVLAALDSRAGRPTRWPADVESDAWRDAASGQPGWMPFAYVLAAAPELMAQLEHAPPASLPAGVASKLLTTAKRIAAKPDEPK